MSNPGYTGMKPFPLTFTKKSDAERLDDTQKALRNETIRNMDYMLANKTLLLALEEISKLGDHNADCNHSGEYLDARRIAQEAINYVKGKQL